MNFKRPRCEYYNSKLYPRNRPWNQLDYLLGNIPRRCPNCGKEVSNAIRERGEKFGVFIFLIQVFCGIAFIFSLILIILFAPNILI